ncbi:GAF domain-containing protein [Ralstonia sp. 1138]|uniref:GAF domain-containing protein n=1 Tax=Ralstonia sp. 1138 TaxID=3156423 RepID=UPI003394F501
MNDHSADARERARVQAVLACGILDTADDPKFDRFTRLACHALGVPMALVSIVDDRRQWFKSRHGLDVRETPRDWAFCTYAIQGTEPFIVEDAAADPLFANNPLVTGHPFIRFYAGVPLLDRSGYALGTLCVLDVVPRQIDAAQIADLQDLAHLCSHLITSDAGASAAVSA